MKGVLIFLLLSAVLAVGSIDQGERKAAVPRDAPEIELEDSAITFQSISSKTTPTLTPSRTPIPTPSSSRTPTRTPKLKKSRTPSRTPSNSRTPSRTPSNSRTPSRTPSNSRTPSRTPTNSPTPTWTPSSPTAKVIANTPTPTPSPSRTPSPTQVPNQNSQPPETWPNAPNGRYADILEKHQAWRQKAGLPARRQQLIWDPELAQFAMNYAKQCVWGHNGARLRNCTLDGKKLSGPAGCGENLYASMPPGWSTGTDITESWGNEDVDYNAGSNTCDAGKVCGHYTQMVWCDTVYIGCALHTCSTGSPFGSGDWDVWVCNYRGRGNFNGQSPLTCMPDESLPCYGNSCGSSGKCTFMGNTYLNIPSYGCCPQGDKDWSWCTNSN